MTICCYPLLGAFETKFLKAKELKILTKSKKI